MVSFRAFTMIAALCLGFMISMSSAVNHHLDSSPEESEEVQNTGTNTNYQSRVKTFYSFARAQETECANYHEVCRLHGPRKFKCCGEGVDLFCKVAYGEFHCFEEWEETS